MIETIAAILLVPVGGSILNLFWRVAKIEAVADRVERIEGQVDRLVDHLIEHHDQD